VDVSNVLIRDVPADDLDQIRAAAAERGTSVQSYLRDALHAQAVYLRRKAALTRTAERLRSQREVPIEERSAILQAIADAHRERSDQLSGHRTQ
jgi:acyl-CoA reductase-like NAD-dependent aldehyde dehydrogenase